jgi:hypothetical protein
MTRGDAMRGHEQIRQGTVLKTAAAVVVGALTLVMVAWNPAASEETSPSSTSSGGSTSTSEDTSTSEPTTTSESTTTSEQPPTTEPPTTSTSTTVPDEGCTRTPGYWKTHADPSSKQFDETWLLVGGPDATFFLSGQSYLEVLEEDKSSGHAYYILAFQWIAAELNQLAGASISGDAAAAFTDAEALFAVHTPTEIGALNGDDPLRQEFISLAATLDAYNNGVTGPGHCD